MQEPQIILIYFKNYTHQATDQRKKNLIRLTSILLVLVVVLEKLEVIHLDIFSNNGAFWVLIAAYAMVVITLKK